MTFPSVTETVLVTDAAVEPTERHSYVDWPAIFAGILLASAIAVVLLTFGSAVGLSFANFRGGSGVAPIWIAIAAATWLLWVEVSSMMAGGYLAGRLRRRAHDASEHESDVRDGAHGLIVWAGALLIGAAIAVAGVGATVGAIGNAASTATQAVATVGGQADAANPTAYLADTLLRPAANGTPSAGAVTAETTAEVSRIFANGALNGGISDEDKAYLAQLVARDTGLSADDAKARVDAVLAKVDAIRQQAADAAETARKTSVLAAFLTAASLLVAAVGAYWAALMGGNHRDRQVVFDSWFRRF